MSFDLDEIIKNSYESKQKESILFDSEVLTYTTYDHDHESTIRENIAIDKTYQDHIRKALTELNFRINLGVKAI